VEILISFKYKILNDIAFNLNWIESKFMNSIQILNLNSNTKLDLDSIQFNSVWILLKKNGMQIGVEDSENIFMIMM
jgi:hypothetical protein